MSLDEFTTYVEDDDTADTRFWDAVENEHALREHIERTAERASIPFTEAAFQLANPKGT